MNYLKKTQEYYAKWLDIEPSKMNNQEIITVKSTKRDKVQRGYTECFHLYCYIMENKNTKIISYSKKLENRINDLKTLFLENDSILEIKKQLKEEFNGIIKHNYKFYFEKFPEDINTKKAVQLNKDDYNDYLEFFKTLHLNTNVDWLYDYFVSIADKGYSWGVYKDNKLVSVTDAPDIPYMKDIIVEPGINTIKNYRRQGYAKIVTGALIKFLINNKKVPIWSCPFNNSGSTGLAHSLGFKKIADVLTVT